MKNAYAILQELRATRDASETISPEEILQKLIELAAVLDTHDHDRDRADELEP